MCCISLVNCILLTREFYTLLEVQLMEILYIISVVINHACNTVLKYKYALNSVCIINPRQIEFQFPMNVRSPSKV